MILSYIKLDLSPSKLKEVIDFLSGMVEPMRTQPGCRGCAIYQDLEDKSIVFEQMWVDRRSLTRHIRSDVYRDVLQVVEMSESQPVIQYLTISKTEGLELIEAVKREPV